jgi:hypothetical protein
MHGDLERVFAGSDSGLNKISHNLTGGAEENRNKSQLG